MMPDCDSEERIFLYTPHTHDRFFFFFFFFAHLSYLHVDILLMQSLRLLTFGFHTRNRFFLLHSFHF